MKLKRALRLVLLVSLVGLTGACLYRGDWLMAASLALIAIAPAARAFGDGERLLVNGKDLGQVIEVSQDDAGNFSVHCANGTHWFESRTQCNVIDLDNYRSNDSDEGVGT